jgi:hypothetical protein
LKISCAPLSSHTTAIHSASSTSIGSQPAGGRQFMSQPAERTTTLRTSRDAIKIINQAVLHVVRTHEITSS